MRVQIPAYTDRWMMGDRFGELIKVTMQKRGAVDVRARLLTHDRYGEIRVGHVRLDKSGRVVRVILDDCEVVS